MKFCKDCKYSVNVAAPYFAMCRRLATVDPSLIPVAGKEGAKEMPRCKDARAPGGGCGPDATLYKEWWKL